MNRRELLGLLVAVGAIPSSVLSAAEPEPASDHVAGGWHRINEQMVLQWGSADVLGHAVFPLAFMETHCVTTDQVTTELIRCSATGASGLVPRSKWVAVGYCPQQ